jgi:DnaK suppressor protein
MTDTAAALAAERERTVARLRALEREFAAIVEAVGSAAGGDDEHDPEGATVAFERQHLAALLAQAREQLAQVDAALGRLADGSYGRCPACGEPVGAERLTARPTAVHCIRCATSRGG